VTAAIKFPMSEPCSAQFGVLPKAYIDNLRAAVGTLLGIRRHIHQNLQTMDTTSSSINQS
jgi:hypothetical protein